MHPILYDIGPFDIRTYGVLLSLAFLIGIWLAVRRSGKREIAPPIIYDLSMVIIVSAVVGSRAYYVLLHRADFAGSPLSALKVWEGGLAMDGGIVLAVLASILFLRARGAPFRRVADIVAPSLALGMAITRIGCYYNGCCFGLPSGTSPGCVFPPGSEAGYRFPGVALYPTQLYSSAYALAIFVALIAVDRSPHREGFLVGLFFVLHALGRFAIDFLRYYPSGSTFEVLGRTFTYNQNISSGLFFFGLAFMAWPHRASAPRVSPARNGRDR